MATQDPTVNYAWNLPLVGGDVGAWGAMLNAILGDDATGVDAIVKGVSNVANAALPKAGGTMTGNLLATDNLYDIGASGATRFRDLFLSRNASIGGTLAGGATTLSSLSVSGASILTGNTNALGKVYASTIEQTVGAGATETFKDFTAAPINSIWLYTCRLQDGWGFGGIQKDSAGTLRTTNLINVGGYMAYGVSGQNFRITNSLGTPFTVEASFVRLN